jgi:nitrogen regulatory protein PII
MEVSKIEVITSMNKLTGLKSALSKVGVTGMTVIQAIGCGVQKGTYEYEPQEKSEMELLPKQYIMIVVENEKVNTVIELIKKELYTGHIGDGKIFVSPISNVVRVRTGEEGMDALM